ncbi:MULTISPECIES: sigma 54-interacting transcriptional regulator [Carboxydocella]|uniref:PAS domain S-box-containing protein n=2 Tax=Carboxydocella TaxID=178898 RepID=A0A1T4LWX8_9FIRM|nr:MULTISPECIES: sigma 54-interacting transcriptional regulator [Carboxydocella]AVX20646.1 PAS domain S-box-containing protein [Carboxydocella thermautotrophica]AVX31068.1 PAS domain S-box-containing protein [Carboxydocella thermautotrophica]SJZ58954.1 PAS domain S-box-containing protein [Carboxydocella sporoproducens DSM 16521]GAW27968.1 Fis family transcriptional regulator [Carboxydocella sp. ULO1]GAW32502.1 Fis family transcriptional regulator [Carboxydocella sp. JDF658]
MSGVRVAIVGMGQGGSAIYQVLKTIEDCVIVGVCDINEDAPGLKLARADGVPITNNFYDFLDTINIDVLIEATGKPLVQETIRKLKPPSMAVMDAQAADLMMLVVKAKQKLLEEKKQLLEIKRIKGEMDAILASVQEAIEVADINGYIKYVNPAFTKITGITAEERIGQNIFSASPDGALAECLRTRKNIYGWRTKVGGTNVEVVSNASPIIIDGQMVGAVVVFNHLTDFMKVMEELKRSTSIIENLYDRLGQITGSKYTFDTIIGNNEELRKVINIAKKAALSNSTILLLGESGTGKELFAHAIHQYSLRRDKPFIKVNCAAIPDSLLESEFFGHEKGAFTGAVKTKLGKFELANGGTIFLDEIGDMNLYLQAKLLRVIQEMEFERVGGTQTIQVDVRIIAATNRDLKELVRKGTFREDLYYRLNVVEITIPPLRQRKDDIILIANSLIVKFNRKLGKKIKGLSKQAEIILESYDWPGNVRELENVIERAMVIADEDLITPKHLVQYLEPVSTTATLPIVEDLIPFDEMEKILLKKALERFGNSVEGKKMAAKALNISLATLYNKLKKYQL